MFCVKTLRVDTLSHVPPPVETIQAVLDLPTRGQQVLLEIVSHANTNPNFSKE